MKTCFIVISYNDLSYIDRCLERLAACTQDGDRVFIIDDDSCDGTAEHLARQVKPLLGAARTELVLLGTHTSAGKGIAANVGLAMALAVSDCEVVFFVEAGGWLEPKNFHSCRASFKLLQADLLLGNYLDYDDHLHRGRLPADTPLWGQVPFLSPSDTEAARDLALELSPGPWRKFYRADLLRTHALQFPEGLLFLEDDPFHWAVCLRSTGIAFRNVCLCHHRASRAHAVLPSWGRELVGLFFHFEAICALIPPEDVRHSQQALLWLLTNMQQQRPTLPLAALGIYAERAAKTLELVPDVVWQDVCHRLQAPPNFLSPVLAQSCALRRGDMASVMLSWQQEALSGLLVDEMKALHSELRLLAEADSSIEAISVHLRNQILALVQIVRYDAIARLPQSWQPPMPPPELVPNARTVP